ncbi:MAG: hypothetical protein M3O21_05005 [Chloroflexota bacterium]|nr:hypothetical protein [Chloroflexota bacterium]
MDKAEFSLRADGPPQRAQGRLLIVAIAGIPTMFILGGIIGVWVIGIMSISLLIGLLFTQRIFWAGSRHGNATAAVEDTELVIRTALATQRDPWTDVASIEVVPFRRADRIAGLVSRFSSGTWRDDPVVRIKLKRSLRMPWSEATFGTQSGGIPSGWDKQVLLSVEHSEAFVRATQDARHRAGYL